MANTPNIPIPISQQQILTDMLSSYAAGTGIASPQIGSANLSFFQVASLGIARASGSVFSTLLNSSLQYATGPNLQLIAQEFQITPVESTVSTGAINVVDTSFQPVSTSIFQGSTPVNVGSVVIFVSSNLGFPSTGSIYIGRGTNNSEGPIGYTSTVSVGNFFQMNLSSPTTKFHNLGESVILSQGGVRTVPVNTIVLAPSTGLVPSQQYSITQTATLLDGQNTVSNIPITALIPGSIGNVAANTITQFASSPFPNATCFNPNPTANGTDPSTNDQIRTQILQKLSSIGLGTATAIENSLIGVSSPTESASITSVNLVNNLNGTSTVYIAAGSVPYEAKTAGVAVEQIVTAAIGGESFFQLATGGTQAPVAEAFVQSTESSPFGISGGMVLAATIGGVTTQHTFQNSDFQAPGAATGFEIAASINANPSLNFQCTTAGSGSFVVLSAKSLTNEETIQVTVPSSPTVVNANNFLGLPTTLNNTLWLYKNQTLLSEDGNTASVLSQTQGLWSNTITNGDTLIITTDNTAPITYTILNTDFIATGLFTTVNASNSLASWVQVFNNKFTGITASIVGTQIELTSNSGTSTRAQISIDPTSTLVSKSMFSLNVGLSSSGHPADYVLDRNTAQFQLVTPLAPGDNLTAGTENTRATVTSGLISGGSITFPSEGFIWLSVDTPVIPISTGVTSGSFISVSSSGSLVSYVSNITSSFANVHPGDYVIIWSPQLNASNRLEGRVHSITTTTNASDTLNILVTSSEASSVVTQSNIQIVSGFVVVRTSNAPQKFNVPTGTNTLDFIASFLQTQTDSLAFTVSLEEFLNIATSTLNTSGSVTVVTLDSSGSQLNFTPGQTSVSNYPLVAHQDSTGVYMPSFFHSTISSDTFASPPDSFLTNFTSNISLSGREPDEILTFINPYGGIDDEQPENEVVQETIAPTTAVNFTQDPDVRRLRINDRFFTSSPLSFGNNDNMVVVMDNNFNNFVFQVPFFRHALTNSTFGVDSNNFNAYDKDFGPTGSFSISFGSNFSFNNYKVLMQAKHILKSTTNQSSVLYRSVPWGSTGQQIVVSYIFNGSATVITSSVTVSNTVSITITVPPSTTASQVVSYVTANLSSWITATAVNDGTGGSPGTGVITANASAQLLDGINWLVSSDIGASPQFTFKKPLAYSSDGTGYSFNNGETIIFSPTTTDQVEQFLNVLPVTGLSTASLIAPANRDSVLELSSFSFGSQGFVEVVGGPASGYSFPLQNGALNINNQFASISAVATASGNVLSGQWFFLQATTVQQKLTNFGTNSDVTIVPNSPVAGQSTVSVSAILPTQLYFGIPRTISGLSGLKFRVEKQGSLVCFSYTNSTSSPQFLTFPVSFNATGGGSLSVSLVAGSGDALYTALTGTLNFSGLSIGDLVTVSGLLESGNNGTFMVTGVSSTTLQVTNSNAVVNATEAYTSGTFAASTGVMEGDSVIVGAPFSPANQGTFRVIRTFNDSFWITNPDFVEEEQILGSNSLIFHTYEATIPGDNLVISGTAFGANSAGTYPVVSVTNQGQIVVQGLISSVSGLNLTGLLSSFYINEGTPYTGYKKVFLNVAQPGTLNLNQILFDTLAQYQKLNQSAGVEVNALQKMEFSTSVDQGLDGYKYNTGLIQQANRVVYGDPSDSLSFPGVAASGTDIFIKPPLVLVINNIALEVRLQTGAPFSSIQQQIQNNVAALINGNTIGNSIAISSILAVCTTIPGVVSVAISSPVFSDTSDLIVVQPNEQTFVTNPQSISVSLIQ